ncbi:2-succinyl-5-enolpyruvyl-6-hydroxy-3-cyclohexene-1-carboxylic-acid synthase [Metasolibacillus meyeri]|uniref:2-succinyl-5-enolpyruvyl-6-hydroxy-3- cyclohexene-1-carboxylic-acid synthase n=1 Tax=Metasolibacillus meyeri TaxID=1071052 RepID=UPI000D2FCF95|nr:2-succinyl-5-enolpyruvyl-6-hydroxy-3-cyclohexene-1-carboxylic-acid synthase [Metasolibacillus meyeri]
MNEREILTNYVYRIVASLFQHGVAEVVVSPGSRSTPLAYAFASTEQFKMHRQIDERAAAFYALGIAKAKGKPVVLLCTSGTAAANYFPALIEAKYARVPLIVLTADRPHELREVGAPQTIDQIRLYGEQVKYSMEFPIPDDAPQTLSFIEHHIARAVAITTTAPCGPVHINIPFREPLLIDFSSLPELTFKASFMQENAPSVEARNFLAQTINEVEKGLIVIGELPLGTDVAPLWAFIRKCKLPALIESLANMRGNVPEDCLPYVISTYDALLKNEHFKGTVAPHTVIRFGAQPVSKFLMQFLTKSAPTHYIVIDEDALFRDSTNSSTHFIQGKPGQWLAQLSVESRASDYLALWQQAEHIARKHIEAYATHAQDEGAFVQKIVELLPSGSDIFVSSSMPIRDIDTFFLTTMKDIRIFANRGTNGIDGVTSTALGFSTVHKRPTYLIIGDLAFLHDANAFVASRYQANDLNIIVMNNDGGGIFSYLPQASVNAHYEDLFGTPTALTFRELAAMYDVQYDRLEDLSTFEAALQAEKDRPIRLLEVMTDRAINVASHRALWQRIGEELSAWLQK